MPPDLHRLLDEFHTLTIDDRRARLAALRQTDPALAAEVECRLTTPEAPADPAQPTHIGRYEVVDLVGRGGMGAVYRVRDALLRRSLALKVLAPAYANDPAMRRRFVEEAQLMGQLQHPGIPPVHDLGDAAADRPFFTMKLIRGQTLAQQLGDRPAPAHDQPRFLGVFEQVCATLAYVHTQGVLHRDLKPDNVMVGAFGEVQVMDWGLGRVRANPEPEAARGSVICTVRSESPADATQAGQVLGTPAYMAPEQARGEIDGLDERADVFALGAILCEILTGEPAYTGWNMQDVLRQARRGAVEPALARLAKCGADAELVALATRCLAAEREGRPRRAEDVHLAVVAYQDGVQQRLRQAELERQEADVRAREERKRRRMAYRLGGVITTLVLVLAGGFAWVRQVQQNTERQEELVRQGIAARFDEAEQTLAAGNADEAARRFAALRGQSDPEFAQRLADRERDLAMLRELNELFGRRWQVVQRVVLEQVQVGRRGEGPTAAEPRVVTGGFVGGSRKAEVRELYAALFHKYGLDVTGQPPRDTARRVSQSLLKQSLKEALEQWFLVEPQSEPLLAVLNALDESAAPARRLLADKAAVPANVEAEDHAPGVALYLSELCPDDQAIALLRRTAQRHPAEYRLLTALVYRLLLRKPAQPAVAKGYALAARALKPADGFACLMAAIVEQEAGQLDEAVRLAKLAVELESKDPEAAYHLGLAYFKKKEYDESRKWLERAIALDPKHVWAHQNLGWICARQGRDKEAEEWYKKALALNPAEASVYNDIGRLYNDRGEYAAAVKWFEKAIAASADYHSAPCNLGWALYQLEKPDEALKWLTRAHALDPKCVTTMNAMGLTLHEKERYDDAVGWYTKALAIDAKAAYVLVNLGHAESKRGRADEAIRLYRKALDLDPKNVWAHNNLGWVYLDAKQQPDEAIAWLTKAIALDPQHLKAHVNLADAYCRKMDYPNAVATYKKALAFAPKDADLHHYLGWVANQEGRYDEAIGWLAKAVVLNPKHADAHACMGHAYLEKEESDQAVRWFKRAVALAPFNADANCGLAAAYVANDEPALAVKLLRPVITLNPKHALAHRLLGEALVLTEKPGEAVEWYTKAIALDAAVAEAHNGLLISLAAAGRHREAVAAVEAARKAVSADDWRDHLLYNAACAYALAAAGTGDAAKLGADERGRLRRQALAWLREVVAMVKGEEREDAVEGLRHLLADADFDAVRSAKGLAALTADERKDWEGFWADARKLLAELERKP